MKHVAIIMDGNRRWAIENQKTTAEGHKAGGEVLKNLLPAAVELKIQMLTVYAFSTENWKRPPTEVDSIVVLLGNFFSSDAEIRNLNDLKIQVLIAGELTRLEKSHPNVSKEIKKMVERTKDNSGMKLVIAFSYGGRQEILDACSKMIVEKSGLSCLSLEGNDASFAKISEEEFSRHLNIPNMPDVDILIRTSGVKRLSNFLLWQASYAELFFVDKFWPDFTSDDLKEIISDFEKIKRNFGGR